MNSLPLISIIIPAYNEEENLPRLFERVNAVTEGLRERYRFEMILLDNASTDRTSTISRSLCTQDPHWKYIRYSRNFGAEASLLAGLDAAAGNAVINLFSDLQDPPELIPDMINKWQQGAEVVYGVVQHRHDSNRLKTLGAQVGYWLIQTLTECKIPVNATDFRLMDQSVVVALRGLREPDRYMRGLVHWAGFRQVPLVYDRVARTRGNSSANLVYCVKFALHAIVCFSSRPLRFIMLFGLGLTLFSAFLAVLYVVLYFTRPTFLLPPPPGLTTVILIALFILGSNSLFLGLIGEYIGRIYNQGKGRPVYIISERVNFED